jgi:hypothetical protein
MSVDKWEREACQSIPAGHARIRTGELRADDLVWSWTTKEWLRADDPEWFDDISRAEDCVCAVRSARVDTTGYGGVRTYRISKQPPAEAPAAVVPRSTPKLLFD